MPENELTPLGDFTPEERAELLRDLREALYTGASRIKFRERDVTFRSAAELRRTIADLENTGLPKRPRKTVGLTTFRRGYY